MDMLMETPEMVETDIVLVVELAIEVVVKIQDACNDGLLE